EQRGKAFYLRGATASGEEAIAVLGEVEVPASTVTCAGCHGADGLGKKEGGIAPGNLTWEHLTKSYGHTHDGNRRHGMFTEAAFMRAVTAGVDPAGNSLAVAMPRYKMQASEMADLIAYLKRIRTDRDPGLSDAGIVIGTLLPTTGMQAETGQAMREVLAAYFDEINNRGGIYNRRIELKVLEAKTLTDAADAGGRGLLEQEKVFALVSGLSADSGNDLFKTVNAKAIPLVGFSTPYTQTESPLNRYVFYLHSGLEDQARALVNFAAQEPESAKRKVSIVHAQDETSVGIARSVEEQAKKNGWREVSVTGYSAQKFDAARLAAELKQNGTNKIFFFGAGGQDKLLVEQLAAVKHYPTVFLLGMLAGRDLLDLAPAGFADKIYLAYPSMPSDLTANGLTEYRMLVEKYKIKVRHTTAQIAALAGAKILIEALQRGGRDISREKLVAALEGLYDFQTAMTPQITYGPNRRKGSAGAYLVTINPERKTFVPASNWIKAN
ncbi:MAG: ABC transporter substrate-binding protein, partial [Acidobacteriota bacterium]|nr:ABC transporter substrate-binding protein [Acidobacteriota bacterium]